MSKRAIFDYPNTCPQIDRAMREAESQLSDVLDALLEEACPLLVGGIHRRDILIDWAKRGFEAVEESFESVRSTNEDMRRAAESQIESLASELSDADAEIEALKQRIHELEAEAANA